MKRFFNALSALHTSCVPLNCLKQLTGLIGSTGMAICAQAEVPKDAPYVLGNSKIGRELSVVDSRLTTSRIFNHRMDGTITPTSCDEFRLRISEGTHTTGTDLVLTSKHFKCTDVQQQGDGGQLVFSLRNEEHDLDVKVCYELDGDDFYMRKQLLVTCGKAVTLERIDVEAVAASDAYQPYTLREISTQSRKTGKQWRPGLGQPLFTKETGTFWGIEFPAGRRKPVRARTLSAVTFI